ncbi:hypothetical protein NLN92_14375 [Citrobacter portucalensis]|uniref:hypothetical protein n=1 Tax=Citrobacter portucalensis TaxID=1639133 RepID=UPI00226B8B20|nr:hypothetical protein [Citrobacter portucalensis]MCX8979195.1 hypothetical protein [Citrobacter portucalensis]
MSQKYFDKQADLSRRAREVLGMLQDLPEHSFFEGVEGIEQVKSVWRSAYKQNQGSIPTALLANAHAALERHILMSESASQATSSGVGKVPAWSVLILPVLLSTATSSMCSFVNADHDVVYLLDVLMKSEEKHGDYNAGASLEGTQAGILTGMRRYINLTSANAPDGTKSSFSFDIKTVTGAATPIRSGTIRLIADGVSYPVDMLNAVDRETDFSMTGFAVPNVTVKVDYQLGTVAFTFGGTVPQQGTNLSIECDLDEEASADLIPSAVIAQIKKSLSCTRYFLATHFTFQAMTDAQKEQGLDMTNLLLSEMTRYVAQEQDFRRLRAALAHVTHTATIDGSLAKGDDIEAWILAIKKAILEESDKLQAINKSIGLTGAICGEKAVQLFRSFPIDYFTPDPSYHLTSGIRRAGRLFGLFDIYGVDDAACKVLKKSFPKFDTDQALFYGSDGNGHSPLVAGDGIAPTLIKHHPYPHFNNRVTLYGMEINGLNPFSGTDYMVLVKLDKI